MIVRKVLQGAAGAAALVGATLATASSAEAECVDRRYVGEAYGLFHTTTGIAARADWRREVRQQIGYEFARWSRSRDRTTRCSRPESGGRWYCRARARPCDN